MLEIRLADEPRAAVRAAAIVTGGKAIESKHFQSPSGELFQGRTADATDSKHDDVERGIRHAVLALESVRRNRRKAVLWTVDLRQNRSDDLPADIGQSEISTGMAKRQPLMI